MSTRDDRSGAPADAESTLAGLTWPPSATSEPVSLAHLLTALQLLATDDARRAATAQTQWDADTPGSLQVLKSGVTGVTKWWLKRAGAAGGVAGLLAAFGGVLVSSVTPFRNALGEPVAVALIVAGAVIIAATVLAIAHFVTGDLNARAHATAARTAARAEVGHGVPADEGRRPRERQRPAGRADHRDGRVRRGLRPAA